MLKVLVDSTPVLPRPSGVGFYVKNLVRALQALSSSEAFDLKLFYQPSFKDWLLPGQSPDAIVHRDQAARRLNYPVRLSAALLGSLARSPQLKSALAAYLDQQLGNPSIIHGTNYIVYPSQRARTILTIYDLTFIRYPDYADAVAKTYERRVRHCLQWTDLVLTISESSKQDIVEYLAVEPDRVWVTPLASQYHALAPALTATSRLPQRSPSPQAPVSSLNWSSPAPLPSLPPAPIDYDLNRPYLLFVSTIEPRKNLVNLIKAFNLLKGEGKIEHNLVLIGKKGWSYTSIFAEIERSPWRSHIFHLDYLPNGWVQEFYRRADVFLYPSHYEGFGLPVLEAMTFGLPVVTSNTSSLPEVAGQAALYADPLSPEAIATQVLRILSDDGLRQTLVQRGYEQVQQFSWEKTAEETLRAYRSLLR